jgi:hypothetical protein
VPFLFPFSELSNTWPKSDAPYSGGKRQDAITHTQSINHMPYSSNPRLRPTTRQYSLAILNKTFQDSGYTNACNIMFQDHSVTVLINRNGMAPL